MFIIAIALLAVLLFFAAGSNQRFSFNSARNTEAENMLKIRFVEGEIDEETYKKMLRTLRSH